MFGPIHTGWCTDGLDYCVCLLLHDRVTRSLVLDGSDRTDGAVIPFLA